MNDSVVLITGGAGNVGREVTRAFLREGARVAVPVYKTDASNALDPLREEFGPRLFSFALDLTTERGAQEAVREVVEWGGRLAALVHLVGGYTGGRPLTDTAVEAWDRMMDLNLKSAWLTARFAIPVMLRQGGGSIVFVSSRGAFENRAGNVAYAVSKAALLTLAETVVEEFGDRGIRANVIVPSTVDTPANRRTMPDADRSRWTDPERIGSTILDLVAGRANAANGAAVPV